MSFRLYNDIKRYKLWLVLLDPALDQKGKLCLMVTAVCAVTSSKVWTFEGADTIQCL